MELFPGEVLQFGVVVPDLAAMLGAAPGLPSLFEAVP